MLKIFGLSLMLVFLHVVAGIDAGGCEPISPSLTTPKNNKTAWNKCLEYQEKYVYPCDKTGSKRTDVCGHGGRDLTVGGTGVEQKEYPHMVSLGYGELEKLKWLCGGSIISEWFILTAAHCTTARDLILTYARLAMNKRTDPIDQKYLYKVGTIIKHPENKPPKFYHDIALLKTEKQMALDHLSVPACLHTGEDLEDEKAVVTGWGKTEFAGSLAEDMQKIPQTKVGPEECSKAYAPHRKLIDGLDFTTQMCYGVGKGERDACQGFGGGPLQVENKKISCMYTVIGVVSFGAQCGVGVPGVFTRVSSYVPWIESIVWN